MSGTIEYDDIVREKGGQELGRVHGKVDEEHVRVFWFSGGNMRNETVPVAILEKVDK